jgi:DnaJ-class molecular chaperone
MTKCLRCNGEGFITLWGVERTDVTCGECLGHGEVEKPFLPIGTDEEQGDD